MLLVAPAAIAACSASESGGAADSAQAPIAIQAAPVCLDYRDTVELQGTLRRETYPGPPNYESIAEGDEDETGYYLHLNEAICARSSGPDVSDASEMRQDSVLRVQLVLDSAGYTQLRSELGRAVALRGIMFSAHTGHHHAPLLLNVLR